jgi:predicted DNA-binding transcriptional regulator AlpA
MIRLLSFKELQARGIIGNWPMLKRRIEQDDFPVGRMIGPNTRRWTEEEVEKWIKSRPVAGPALKGVAKTRRGNPRKSANSTDATTTTTV